MKQQLRYLFPAADCSTQLEGGRWVRAVPMPFPGGLLDRLRDAWSVLKGETFAIHWPEAGELEAILDNEGASIVPHMRAKEDVIKRAHQLGMHKANRSGYAHSDKVSCPDCFAEAINQYLEICTEILSKTPWEAQTGAFINWFRKYAPECDNFLIFNDHPAYVVGDYLGIAHDAPEFHIIITRAAQSQRIHFIPEV